MTCILPIRDYQQDIHIYVHQILISYYRAIFSILFLDVQGISSYLPQVDRFESVYHYEQHEKDSDKDGHYNLTIELYVHCSLSHLLRSKEVQLQQGISLNVL